MAGSETPYGGSKEDSSKERDEPEDRRRPLSYGPSRESYAGIPTDALGSLAAARAFVETIVDTVRDGLLVLDPDLRVQAVNESFCRTFEVQPEEALGRLVYDLDDGQWDIPPLRHLLEEVLPERSVVEDYEVTHAFGKLGERTLLLNARRLDHVQLVLLAIQDATARRRAERERERVEEALRESRTMLRLVLDHIPQGVFWKDRGGRYLGANAVVTRASGLATPEDIVGLYDHELPGVTPEQAAFFGEKDREVMESGEPVLGIEEPLGRPDGSTLWLRTNKVPLRDGAGRVVGVLGTWEDVTEQQQAAEALRQLADAVPHLVWTARPDGAVDYFNTRASLYDGLQQRDDGSWEWSPVLHPDDVERTAEAWRRAVETGEPYEVEHRVRMADGTYRWHVSRALPARDADDEVVRWHGTATDIHRVKEAEMALHENAERLRRAQKAAHVGVWDLDLVTGETYWSEGVFDLVGLPPEAGVPTAAAWESILHPDDRELVDRRVQAAIVAGGSYESEFRIVRPDGEVVWLAAQGHVVPDEEGRPVRLLGVNFDVTFRKQAEMALEFLNKTLEARVAERTRQVRELSRALTLAEQRERQRIAHVLHDDLQQVLFGAKMAASLGYGERLQTILSEAMALTRTLSHELSPSLLQGENLEDLLQWLAERARERHGLEVEVDIRGDVLVLAADLRVLLYQILRELLFNVVKHAETKRALILAERVDGHIRVIVEDAGRGFDPSTPSKTTADGLGLRSVRERLELVGGRVEVDSAPGRGTRVTITMPVEDVRAAGG